MDEDINLGHEDIFLHSQEISDYGQSYQFTECDIIPAGGYFLVASARYPGGEFSADTEVTFNTDTADAVVWLRIVANSTAGRSWVETINIDGEGDALGWGTNPLYYEGTPAAGGLAVPYAWFRTAYGTVHVDTENNSADFTRQTHAPVGSGQIDQWYCQTLWPIEDLPTQDWVKSTDAGATHYYQAVGSLYDPLEGVHFLRSSYATGAGGYDTGAETWFKLSRFCETSAPDFVSCWGKVHVQVVAWGVQSGTAGSNVWLKSGITASKRDYKFGATIDKVDDIPTWHIDPDTGYTWNIGYDGNHGLNDLEIGIENDDNATKILTQFYALVWYMGVPPPPTPVPPTPTPTMSPTPSPTPSPSPTASPTPSPSPTASPSPTPTIPPTPTPKGKSFYSIW